MSRLRRLFVPALASHITLRGNDRQDIFRCDGDRTRFLEYLADAARRNGLAVHAYVLMTNHVHLLATGHDSRSAPRTIQSVGRRYVAYFNGRYGRTGTLWEGRYRSTLVETDRYLFACHRYIDMNPVRAGLAAHPAAYRWSSHRFYAVGCKDELPTPHSLLRDMAATETERRKAYMRLFDRPLDDEILERIRFCSNKGWALGSDEFCESVGSAAQRRARPIGTGWKKGRKRGPRKMPRMMESDPLI
jgi:putative transposase